MTTTALAVMSIILCAVIVSQLTFLITVLAAEKEDGQTCQRK
jgi:hypothetical protein